MGNHPAGAGDVGMPCEFETLAKLAEEHGDAYYLVHPQRFRANLRALGDAFRAVYPRTVLGYSYKANYTPLLCRLADEEGCYAEVVSKMEYDLALRVGVAPRRVIFNGPLKTPAEIEEALLAGAVVNVDSVSEIDSVEALSRRHPDARLRVGVRCQFALSEGHTSRFGIASEGGDLHAVLERLRELPNCTVQGLHCHFSAHRGLGSFRLRAEKMVELAREHFPDAPPPSLDIGGGFFGSMPDALRAQFDEEVPGYSDYAREVASVFAAAFPGDAAPELVLEPGVGVVADAVDFVCRVAALKRLGEQRLAVATGSIQNIKATPHALEPPVRVVSDRAGAGRPLPGPVVITGYTCMETDVLHPGYPGELRVGDFLVFQNAGAYTSVFKPPFIRPAPAMLSYSEGENTPTVARRREHLDDLLSTYVL
jgi:diaminopimelate decarboxylase